MTTERTHTRIDGFRLHAQHDGAGEPVLLLHGLCGSCRWWRYTVPALSETFRVHVPEMIGFGRSRDAVRQPTLPEMAGLLVRWLDALEIERTHFVGHSMGAQVAVHLASRWPDRIDRLVLTNAAGIPHPLSLATTAKVAGELVWPRSWGRLDFLPTIASDTVRTGPGTTLRAIASILADDIRPLLPRISAPTLLLWGEHDPLTPVDDGRVIADLIPHARLQVVEGASHNPMVDRPGAFNRHLKRFLETRVPSGDGAGAGP